MSIGFGFFLFSIISAFLNTLFRSSTDWRGDTAHRCNRNGEDKRVATADTDGPVHYAILGVLGQFFLILKLTREKAATSRRKIAHNPKMRLRMTSFVGVGSLPGRIVSITPL